MPPVPVVTMGGDATALGPIHRTLAAGFDVGRAGHAVPVYTAMRPTAVDSRAMGTVPVVRSDALPDVATAARLPGCRAVSALVPCAAVAAPISFGAIWSTPPDR